MKKIVKHHFTFISSLIGLAGGFIWYLYYEGGTESLILTLISFIEIVSYFIINTKETDSEIIPQQSQSTSPVNQMVNLHVSLAQNHEELNKEILSPSQKNVINNRNIIIDSMKPLIKILFIDDDKNFNVVKILKDSGWKNTRTITDIKTLEIAVVKESEIIFVDINGVGILLELEYEGLDLAQMLKQRFPEKKIIIYSANKNSNSFHNAWDLCDYKLEKNALPYQFQNLVEEYSIEIYNNKIK